MSLLKSLGADVITITQDGQSFTVSPKDLAKYPMSFITTMVASNFAEGNQTDLEVKGRNTGYFKYISQMYTQDSVELETNERKEDFLDEFSFWFPGEEQNAVQYKDISLKPENSKRF
eukprot:Phypoly_transcript_22563.p1 GENE.Phypoly_transcript_22563~~Phypoly_transcript_22563.p1  ORF type:complete len:117 (+),score=17.74 Phypoly_transcript_22563:58-408(+)